LAADPQNGNGKILGLREILELGGNLKAEFVIDVKPGFSVESSFDGPLVRTIPAAGNHRMLRRMTKCWHPSLWLAGQFHETRISAT
jgi:hypothetical protein